MSRIFDSDYARMLGLSQPSVRSQLPQVDLDAEGSSLNWALEKSLGGLGYIGSVLNKPGRAVRGLLDGNLNEGLSWLPFSDSLGITDESNEVTGRDLLSQIGLTTKRQEGESFNWTDDLLGMGAEVLTDPTSFVGFGLNAAGKAAQKSGQLAEGLLTQARAGQRGLTAGLPFQKFLTGSDTPLELLTGKQVLDAGSAARAVVTQPTRLTDWALDSTLGITPFAGTQRRVYENVGEPLGRRFNQWFDPSVKDAGSAEGQVIGRAANAVERTGDYQAGGDLARRTQALKALAGGDAEKQVLLQQAMQQAIEQGGDGTKVLEDLQKAARQTAAEKITPWYTPDMDGYTENLSNLRQFKEGRIGLDELTESNRINLDDKLGAFDQSVLKGVLPGGESLPTSAADLTLLNALRDRIDEGFVPTRSGDNWMLDAGPKVQQADRQAVIDAIAADEQFGPRSLIDPSDPGGVLNKRYRRELRDFAADPSAGLNDILFHGEFGDLATEAVKKLDKMPEYRRTMKLDKAIEYAAPKGKGEALAWAEKNLTPDDKVAFDGMVQSEKDFVMKADQVERATGAMRGSMIDAFVDYLPRHIAKYPKDDPRAKLASAASSYWKEAKASNESFTARKDIFRDVPGGTSTISEWSMDPRLSGAERTLSPEQVAAEIRLDLTGTATPAPGNPAWKQSEKLAEWLGSLPADHAAQKIPYFSVDIPQLMLQRQKGVTQVEALGKAMETAWQRFAKPKAELEAAGVTETMTIRELAERMNFTGADEKGNILAQKILGKERMAGMEKGQTVTLKALGDLSLDKRTAEDMLRMNQSIATPAILKPVLDAYDNFAGLMKTYLTRPFLSFHTRNAASGLYNTWRSAGVEGLSPQQMKGVVGFLRGGDSPLAGVSRDDLIAELTAGGLAFKPNTTMTADILGKGGEIAAQGINIPETSGRSIAGDVLERIKGVGRSAKESGVGRSLKAVATPDNSFIRMMNDGGQQIEDFLRTNHYVTLRKQGFDPRAAADEVMKYQIDYSKMTAAGRSVFRRVFPWFSFSSGTLPTVLEDLVSQPGKIVNTVRAVTGGRASGEFVPGWIGEGAALPLGQNDDGTQRYLSSFGLPVEDESFKAMGSLAKGDVTRAAEQALGMTFPWFKSPLELLFNKQLSSGRPLTDLKPYEFASLGGLLNDRQARVLTEVAANTPASRTLSTINSLTDDRKGPGVQALNLATGIKQTDVDVGRARDNAILKMLGQDLLGRPGVRTREEVYVNREGLPNLSEEDRKRYAAYLAAEQRLRDKAKEKRSQQP